MIRHRSCPFAGMTAVARGVAEGVQQAHHIVVVFRRRQAAAGHPIEQFDVGTVEQSFEAVELAGIEAAEGRFRRMSRE